MSDQTRTDISPVTRTQPLKFGDKVRELNTYREGTFHEWRGPNALVRFATGYRLVNGATIERAPI